ncbi:MAG: four helix bundle protein [Candidatus Marinimicrobia bacterium]|jgi:four helix bundle protein|nr:four helix bundle protein [Candidatus Neomarinimicrobiota bacterium]MCK9560441.1 four helix bundle protein [Candidatus Neomarinimicrobiota bacterium]MDD5230828.1 four helix bundle protein [Candidatus Neomarinimicrobiota bacterium]MDD5540528.1 four helix bundle protein [Candidatus Neomarinimicrobiota bacterium]
MEGSEMTPDELAEILLDFAVKIVNVTDKLSRIFIGRHIGGQLFRSATSAGTNYGEARAAESRSDFIHKMSVVLKELNETNYWLLLIKKSELLPTVEIEPLISESTSLSNIIGKSLITARKKGHPKDAQ